MLPTIVLDTRWVCPATIASTVVSANACAMGTIGPSQATAGLPSMALEPSAGALMDHDDLHVNPAVAQPLGLCGDPVGRGQELQARGVARRDQFRRFLQTGADHTRP